MPRKRKRISRYRYPPRNIKTKRNYDDPAYKKWRTEVFQRDSYTCQWPKCTCKEQLQAHHILKWADYPLLRYLPSNGITLCKKHHDFIKNKEEAHAALFHKILEQKFVRKIKRAIKKGDKNKDDS